MYGTIAEWRTYATARGDDTPTAAGDDDATAALVRASDHIRLRYVPNFLPGYDTTTTPTGFDYPLVEEAAFTAATLELATPGFFAKTYTPAEQKVLTGVDTIKWTVTGNADRKHAAAPVSTLIEAIFEPYTTDADGPKYSIRSIGGVND